MRSLALLSVVVLLAVVGGVWLLGDSEEALPEDLGAVATRAPAEAESAASVELAAPEGLDAAPAREAVDTAPVAVTPRAKVRGGATVTGRVLDDQGRAVSGAEVSGRRSGFALLAARDDDPSTRTDDGGRFELALPEPGDLRLVVTASGFAPLSHRVTAVADSQEDVGDLHLERGVVLSGRVSDRLGRPVAGAELRSPMAQDSGFVVLLERVSGDLLATTGADGRFEVDTQAIGPWTLLAYSETHPVGRAEGRTELANEQVAGIEIMLEDGFEIEGRVVGAPADELGALVVRARAATMEGTLLIGGSGRVAQVERDGRFRIRGLEGGKSYRLRARIPSDDLFGGASRSSSIPATAGDIGVELRYSRGASIAFQVVDDQTGAPLIEYRAEAGFAWRRTLADDEGKAIAQHPDGRARFEGLRPPEGNDKLSLAITAVGYEDNTRDGIVIAADQDLDLGVIRMRRIPVVRVVARSDTSGLPLAGARVTLAKWREPTPGRMEVRRSFSFGGGPDGGGDGPITLDGDAATQTGRTDENGVCILSSFPGEKCTISVRADEHAPMRSEPIALPALGDFDYEARLFRGGRVMARALDAAGEPLVGATIERRAPTAPGTSTVFYDTSSKNKLRTDSEGGVMFENLEPGLHSFRLVEQNPAQQGGMVLRIIGMGGDDGGGWTEVTVMEDAISEVVLVAVPRGALYGTVTEAGAPLANAKVRLLPKEKSMGPDFAAIMGTETSTRSDGSGRYEFEDLKSDEYRIEVTHESRAMPMEFPIDVRAGDNKRDIDLPVSIVTGRVLNEAGEPLAGMKVTAKPAGASGPQAMRVMIAITSDGDDGDAMISTGGFGGDASVTTDEDGRYELRGVTPDADLVVEARGGDYEPTRSATFHVGPGELRSGVDVEARIAGWIDVETVQADGSPANNLLVRARFAGDSETPVEPKVTFIQTAGKGRLSGLRAGPWEVTVSKMGPGGADPDSPMQTIEVLPGEGVTARFALP